MPNMTNDQRRARVQRGRRRMEEGDKQRGKLGILVNGFYVFWNPAHTGYCYCRIEHGVETEIAECIPKTALDPYARVVFVREGPALVAVDPNSLDAVNIYGQAAPALGVPSQPMGNRGSGDWTPTDGNILLANGTQFSSTPLATAFEDWIGYLASGASFALTVASNVLTVGTESSVVVSPQTGTTDDVQQVIVSGFPRLLLLIAAAGCTITLKQFVGGSDNIYVFGGADLAFTDIEVALGWWDGTKLFVTGGGGGSGGFYQTVQDNGADQTQRGKLNFIGATIADNPGNDSTDVTVTGGGGGSALASDKKSLTSGDVAVTSTSFVDLDSALDITLTTGARRCKVSWNLVVTSTGSQSQVDVEIDGVRQGGAFGLLAASAASINANLSGTFLTDVLAAGSHTFKLMVRVDSATSTYRASTADNPAIFSVEEQADIQGGGGFSPVLIYDYTLPSDGTFDTNTTDDLGNTGISQLYTDLELRISGIGAAGVTGGVEVFFNGDTNTAHYDGGRTLINGGSSGGDLNEIGFVGTPGVGLYGSIIADIPGYTISSIHRTLIARSAVDGGGTSPNYWLYGMQYSQAGALTRFQAHCRLAGNFAAGSRLRIYGIP